MQPHEPPTPVPPPPLLHACNSAARELAVVSQIRDHRENVVSCYTAQQVENMVECEQVAPHRLRCGCIGWGTG